MKNNNSDIYYESHFRHILQKGKSFLLAAMLIIRELNGQTDSSFYYYCRWEMLLLYSKKSSILVLQVFHEATPNFH